MTIGSVLLYATSIACWALVAWGWYRIGRRAERAKMREENGWWAGFRAGLEQQKRIIQAELLERGVVLKFNDPPTTKHN